MSWLQNQIAQNPHNLYIELGIKKWSYLEIDEMVQTYAQALLGENIKPKDRVLIYLPSEIKLVEIILACFEIGAIATPISTKLTKSERDVVIEKIQPNLIITNQEYQSALSPYFFPLLNIVDCSGSSS